MLNNKFWPPLEINILSQKIKHLFRLSTIFEISFNFKIQYMTTLLYSNIRDVFFIPRNKINTRKMQVNIYKIKKKSEYNRPEYSQKQENFGMSINVIAVRRRYLHTNIWSVLIF